MSPMAMAPTGESGPRMTTTSAVAPPSEPRDDVEALRMYEAAAARGEGASAKELADVKFNTGNVLSRLGRREADAEKAYRECVALDPGHLAARNNLALLLLRRGDAVAAVAELRRGLDSYEESTPVEERVEAQNNLGLALVALRRSDEAMAAYETAIADSGGRDPRPLANLGTLLNNLAAEHEDHQNHRDSDAEASVVLRERALNAHRSAAALAPSDPDLRFNVAATLDDAGLAEEAIVEYRAALAIDPRHAVAHNNLALALEQVGGEPTQVLYHLQAAVDVDPSDADAWFNLANCRRDDDLSGALFAYEQAAAHGSNPDAHLAAAHVAAQLGKLQPAIDHAKIAVRLLTGDDRANARTLLRDLLTLWRDTLHYDDYHDHDDDT